MDKDVNGLGTNASPNSNIANTGATNDLLESILIDFVDINNIIFKSRNNLIKHLVESYLTKMQALHLYVRKNMINGYEWSIIYT